MSSEPMNRLISECIREVRNDPKLQESVQNLVRRFERLSPSAQIGLYERELIVALGALQKLSQQTSEVVPDALDQDGQDAGQR